MAKNAKESGKKPMKIHAGVSDKAEKKKRHIWSAEDISFVRGLMNAGLGYRSIYQKCVLQPKKGKKPWTMGGLDKLTRRIKKNCVARKPGQGRKRTVRTPGTINAVRKHVEANPGSAESSVRKVCAKFKLSKGSACRILCRDINTKSLQKVKGARLSTKQRERRVAFAEEYIAAVDNGSLDVDSVFFSDEKLFQSGNSANPRNDRVRVPKNVAKSKMPPDEIVRETAGKYGLQRIMCSMAIAKIGLTPPFFIPKGTKINGATYLEHLDNNLLPSMSAIAMGCGKQQTFSLQQDGATSHHTEPVLKSIKKNTGRVFPFSWPAKSPDLNPCDYYLWGKMEAYIEAMAPQPNDEASLRTAVTVAASAIDKDEIGRAIDSLYERCKMVIETEGARFEYKMK